MKLAGYYGAVALMTAGILSGEVRGAAPFHPVSDLPETPLDTCLDRVIRSNKPGKSDDGPWIGGSVHLGGGRAGRLEIVVADRNRLGRPGADARVMAVFNTDNVRSSVKMFSYSGMGTAADMAGLEERARGIVRDVRTCMLLGPG